MITRKNRYAIWYAMQQRCTNPSNKDYLHYGGRGITICAEWDIFNNFESWMFSSDYKVGLSIERVNNDGNYCPANCTWIPQQEQVLNRRTLKNNSTGYPGISFTTATQKFRPVLRYLGARIYLGEYSSIEEAVLAYNNAVIEYKSSRPLLSIKEANHAN